MHELSRVDSRLEPSPCVSAVRRPRLHITFVALASVLVAVPTNAQQAVRSVASSGSIGLRTRLENGRAVLEVQDDGPGIPADVRAKIFDPFFTTKPEGQGTGLGLSLVYGILRDHGGFIEVLQDVPSGSRRGRRR